MKTEFVYEMPVTEPENAAERLYVGEMAQDVAKALERKFTVTLAVEPYEDKTGSGFRIVSRGRTYAAEQNEGMSLYAEGYAEGFGDALDEEE
jgi:tRNA(His) 5'-end guanylyltransferase